MAANFPQDLNMAYLLNFPWTVYKLSPLFGFSKHRLSQYSIEFKQFLQHDVNEYNQCNFSFDFPQESENKLDEFDVLKFIGNNKKNDIILYVSLHFQSQFKSNKKFEYFPFVLLRGNKFICDRFFNFLEDRFDCLVCQIQFSFRDMLELGLLSLNSNFEADKEFTLLFTLPLQVQGCKYINMSISADTVYKLWCSILETGCDLNEGITEFGEIVRSHFKCHFELNISDCKLFEIKTPTLTVYTDGDLRVLDTDVVKLVLYHFHQRLTDAEVLA